MAGGVRDVDASEESAPSIVIVDYGLGNLRSVRRGLERAGADVVVSDQPEVLPAADGIVLPGVGAFSEGMENAGPFRTQLTAAAEGETPLLGICLGMQMLLSSSEEAERAGQGDAEGLGLIPGRNVRFSQDVKIPHMGWNELAVGREHPLVAGINESYAYFVHSYYADPDEDAAVVATAEYGTTFPAVIADESGTVMGTQFHPEKSGETGLQLLRNFVHTCRR